MEIICLHAGENPYQDKIASRLIIGGEFEWENETQIDMIFSKKIAGKSTTNGWLTNLVRNFRTVFPELSVVSKTFLWNRKYGFHLSVTFQKPIKK